jgi:hypothetical protein
MYFNFILLNSRRYLAELVHIHIRPFGSRPEESRRCATKQHEETVGRSIETTTF